VGAWGAMPGAFAAGITAIAVGGSLFMFAALHATFMFPRSQATAMAAISCLFDGSTVVFALVRVKKIIIHGIITHAQELDPCLLRCALVPL
jgi:hypothetical protein